MLDLIKREIAKLESYTDKFQYYHDFLEMSIKDAERKAKEYVKWSFR